VSTLLTVCDTCAFSATAKTEGGLTGGAILAGLVETLRADPVAVRRHSCLMGCQHPCNVAIGAPGKMTYVLGGFAPERGSAEAILAFAALHGESPTGQVAFRSWPQGVRGHFIARVPPDLPAG
jgi:predicted metal-binding protein